MALMEYLERDCPYCGESSLLAIDLSVSEQSYIEDCQVCCRPMSVSVRIEGPGQLLTVTLRGEDE